MIKNNEYFGGKVKSLGFDLDGTQYTTGVFLPGEFSVDTESEEHVTVTAGKFKIRLSEEDWKEADTGKTVVIPATSNFQARVEKPMAYICEYK